VGEGGHVTLREGEPCINAYRGGAAVQFGEDAGVEGKAGAADRIPPPKKAIMQGCDVHAVTSGGRVAWDGPGYERAGGGPPPIYRPLGKQNCF
jgi:hypothetical protein